MLFCRGTDQEKYNAEFPSQSRSIDTDSFDSRGRHTKRHIKYCSVSVPIFFLTACASMQPLTGEFTEENIDSKVKINDDILVFHKTQGQMPIKFVRADQEYLFLIDIYERHNPYSVMDGRIHLKDIDRIEITKRSEGVQSDGFWENYEVFPGEIDGMNLFFWGVVPLFLLLLLL